jgi:transposase-like protein
MERLCGCTAGAGRPGAWSLLSDRLIYIAMALTRRHSKAEIAAKIIQADDLASQGMLKREIAQALGVSAMTLHRWRQARPTPAGTGKAARAREELAPTHTVAKLELENSRLRRLVVELLLERIELEERAHRNNRSIDRLDL